MERQKLFITQLKQLKQHVDEFYPENNHFDIIHVTFSGDQQSVFKNMKFHVRLDLTQFPERAPVIKMLSKSSVYDIDTPLCINGVSHFHEESWQSTTTISDIIDGIKIHMLSLVQKDQWNEKMTGIGSHYKTEEEVINETKDWKNFKCSQCKCDFTKL